MKIFVDELPDKPSACPFSEWDDVLSPAGELVCKLDGMHCALWCEGCRWLKEIKEVKDLWNGGKS